jgi:predicted enzyme related to lactoylglutathione lyase
MPRVVHFEIHAEDPQRAIDFYSRVFGWGLRKWHGPEDYWFITTGPADQKGVNGGLVPRRDGIDGTAVTGYVCTIDVPSVDAYAESVEVAGGTIVTPKFPIPGYGWLAHAKDTEGNLFSMMEAES